MYAGATGLLAHANVWISLTNRQSQAWILQVAIQKKSESPRPQIFPILKPLALREFISKPFLRACWCRDWKVDLLSQATKEATPLEASIKKHFHYGVWNPCEESLLSCHSARLYYCQELDTVYKAAEAIQEMFGVGGQFPTKMSGNALGVMTRWISLNILFRILQICSKRDKTGFCVCVIPYIYISYNLWFWCISILPFLGVTYIYICGLCCFLQKNTSLPSKMNNLNWFECQSVNLKNGARRTGCRQALGVHNWGHQGTHWIPINSLRNNKKHMQT